MTKNDSARILAVGMVTPLGLSARTTTAAVRGNLSFVRKTRILDRHWLSMGMSLVSDDNLPLLSETPTSAAAMTTRQTRMLQLAKVALGDLLKQSPKIGRVPWLIAVPEKHPKCSVSVGADFLRQLREQTGVDFDERHSSVFPRGRAGGILALKKALQIISADADSYVIVGGVDTHLDLFLLSALDAEERIRSPGVRAGYVPGEGAAFLLIASAKHAERWNHPHLASIRAAAWEEEAGHLYSEQPHRGDGLALAFRHAFQQVPAGFSPVRSVYAGMNGEHLFSKEWGVAYLRHQKRFAENATLDHPVDCLGDPGAALAPILLGLSAFSMIRKYRPSPSLVWCASDLATRGAALLDGPE